MEICSNAALDNPEMNEKNTFTLAKTHVETELHGPLLTPVSVQVERVLRWDAEPRQSYQISSFFSPVRSSRAAGEVSPPRLRPCRARLST